MALPNVVSLLRIGCVPIVLILMICPGVWPRRVAALVFLAASISDFVDGWLARRGGAMTPLGQFLDPLADKLLIAGVLIMLVAEPPGSGVPAWVAVVIVLRELAVTGLRGIASQNGMALPAEELGKYKMLTQIFALQGLVLAERLPIPLTGIEIDFRAAGLRFLWVALILSVWSGIDYHIKVFRRLAREGIGRPVA
jgi:CDP-diacylglycerol--glycerol-3-phosphate 3-phosphatidyltransferase